MQVQAQDETKPITLALRPGADAASAAGISPTDDLYLIRAILCWERSKEFRVSLCLREVGSPNGGVISWLEMESMGGDAPVLPPARVHPQASGRRTARKAPTPTRSVYTIPP